MNSAAVSSWEPGAIEWTEVSPGFEEGYLDVPIDYAHPRWWTLRLYMSRRLADDPDARVGSLLVNPGGPGFGGSGFVNYVGRVFDPEVLDAFDFIGFDPRGTGLSEPAIDCVDDYDHFYAGTDITPDDDAERQQIVDLAEEFADACVANNAEIIQFVGTNNAARDIDSIRRSLGEEEISFFGWSYGSELGGMWATMFPTTVRAAVFDAAPDPNADELQGAAAGRELRGHADDVPGSMQRRPWLCLPQRRRRRRCLRRADAATRCHADPEHRRTARHHPWCRLDRRRPGDVRRRHVA